ncbi:hypothetical protein K466DRAFT_604058 [Polyporus arcularius HHB13444]|uniref:F-box domain-containing protein n=1 Tax=Polyporus arcularius HHB13444 TaxID=1314778 RepID=A0A5C3P0X8_9APHY|nr:hypothetical protein K466DRAFT_604058 [Polyporus arcularius HHB13444]
MDIRNNYEDDIADLVDQAHRILDAHQDAMSLSSLRSSFKKVNGLKATLAERINSRMLVNGLPNELLIEVFKFVTFAGGSCPTLSLNNAKVQTRPLLSLTHVCRRWRRTALGYPLLWRRIDCHNPEQFREFGVQRSYPGPISLFIDVRRIHDSGDKDALRLILEHSDRLHRLDIAYGLETREHVPHSGLLDLNCPDLECLTVNRCSPAAVQSPIPVSRKLLFCGGLSRLRALAIAPIPDWLPANPLPALTHLYLSFYWYTDLRTSFILSFLRSAPALEMLQLSRFLMPRADGPEDLASTPVPLSRLKYILFSRSSDLESALAVLSQLVIPESARTYLDCINIHSEAPSSVLPLLPPTANTRTLTVYINHTALELVAEGRDSGFWLSGWESPDSNQDCFTTWLTHLPVMFPLSRCLSYLQLQLEQPGSVIVQILRETVSLTTLELGITLSIEEPDGGEDSLVQICRALSEGSGGTEPLPHLCPELRVLTIRPYSSDSKPVYTRWREAIHSMLCARIRLRRPIHRLAMQPVDFRRAYLEIEGKQEASVEEVLADYYASLADHVHELVLPRSREESIVFHTPRADWGEVERYWIIHDDDRPELL